MAQRAVSTKDALKHVNKRIGQARGSLRRQISLPVLFGAAGLVAFGCLIIWTASLTISAASFSRHLIGIGLGRTDVGSVKLQIIAIAVRQTGNL